MHVYCQYIIKLAIFFLNTHLFITLAVGLKSMDGVFYEHLEHEDINVQTPRWGGGACFDTCVGTCYRRIIGYK
jgi:hypothetical protein